MKIKVILLMFTILFYSSEYAQQEQGNKTKHKDYVPNEETAIKIAEAIWLSIYGNDIYEEKPFVAILKDFSVWKVRGSLPAGYKYGGVAYIEIRKYDCKILKVYHTK